MDNRTISATVLLRTKKQICCTKSFILAQFPVYDKESSRYALFHANDNIYLHLQSFLI